MLNSTPYWQSPLHEQLAQFKPDVDAAITATELPRMAYITVRCKTDDGAIAAVLGGALPQTMGVAHTNKAVTLWLSPDEWLVIAPYAHKESLLNDLLAAIDGRIAQVVDNSGGYTSLRLTGEPHMQLLRHLTPYDVESLKIGQCAATLMSKSGVTLVRTTEHGMTLVCRRSFADYIWCLIQKAARPYGLALGQVSNDDFHTQWSAS